MATGSDKRQRTRLITFRVTEEEYARYIERASRAALAVRACARAAGLEGAGPVPVVADPWNTPRLSSLWPA
ncbi:MAG: hypothetical protein IPN50_07525 [Sphingomonadales bacterium]|nr:hypothetical protein [Sphingomonadales bacterium]